MRVSEILGEEGLIEADGDMPEDHEVGDLTREPMEFPMSRDLRLQALARGDEGFLLALGYSTQRGYGRNHPFTGEIRIGEVEVEFDVPELGFAVSLGVIQITECQMVNQFKGSAKRRRNSPVATAWCSARASARRWRCHWWIAHYGLKSSARISLRRPRTKNSSSPILTTSRRPDSSSI